MSSTWMAFQHCTARFIESVWLKWWFFNHSWYISTTTPYWVFTLYPDTHTCTEDFICASVGLRHTDIMKKTSSISIQRYNLLWLLTTWCSSRCRWLGYHEEIFSQYYTSTSSIFIWCSNTHGHCFWLDVSLGNIHYALLFTDRYSRMTYLYPLQNLTTDIRKQMECFFAHLGFTPSRLITDLNTKLIEGKLGNI